MWSYFFNELNILPVQTTYFIIKQNPFIHKLKQTGFDIIYC